MFENRLHSGLSLDMCLKCYDELGVCCQCACKLTIRKGMCNARIIYATLVSDKQEREDCNLPTVTDHVVPHKGRNN